MTKCAGGEELKDEIEKMAQQEDWDLINSKCNRSRKSKCRI
jgi:hypothetical protein